MKNITFTDVYDADVAMLACYNVTAFASEAAIINIENIITHLSKTFPPLL